MILLKEAWLIFNVNALRKIKEHKECDILYNLLIDFIINIFFIFKKVSEEFIIKYFFKSWKKNNSLFRKINNHLNNTSSFFHY